jgi:hypothetical protein
MRIHKDIWMFIKILPHVFKTIRHDSKMMVKLMKSEEKEGRVNTFLHLFESEVESLPLELIQFSLINFLDAYNTYDYSHPKDPEALVTLKQYCLKYGVEYNER